MIDMEMTKGENHVDVSSLAADLQRMMQTIMAEDIAFTSGVPFNTKEQADELNKMMLEIVEVGKRHGIHFPRDFALLTKQLLYFDRFMRTLAPDMDMFSDHRVAMLGRPDSISE
jgi:predicted unusual protein kinase regulating ubiquinone biosynthesis (AarF/ABC1/UbiB family)